MKVLVVEDDPLWLTIFHNIIAKVTDDFFEYYYVDTLEKAINIIQTNQIELILLDLMLPDSMMEDTIKTMTTHAKNIPIVVMTTLDDEKLMQSAFVLGVEDYLIKDQCDIKIFVHVTRQAIRRFIGKFCNNMQQDLIKIIENLKSADKKLAALDK